MIPGGFCMKKTRISTEVMVVTAFMIALSVVLSKLISINISFLRIGFGFLPIAILAILYGPWIAALGYGLADLIGAWLLPTGTFFPGFTVSAVLTGLIFGFVLYNKEVTITRALIASALVCLGVNLILNTFWLTFIIGKGFKVLLASRAVKEIVAIPVMALLIVAMDRCVIKAVRNRSTT
jgi:ECF transporter S component (folate family)